MQTPSLEFQPIPADGRADTDRMRDLVGEHLRKGKRDTNPRNESALERD